MVGLISFNYKIAPLDIREKFYFDNPEKIVFNNLLKKKVGCEGLMIISTCNRTEIYFEFENHVGEEKKFLHAIVKELVEFKKFKELIAELKEKNGEFAEMEIDEIVAELVLATERYAEINDKDSEIARLMEKLKDYEEAKKLLAYYEERYG